MQQGTGIRALFFPASRAVVSIGTVRRALAIFRARLGGAMTREKLLARISIDPKVCFGKPCIRGHRIWVSLILDLLADGMTVRDVINEYPQLTEPDVLACIAYGAEMARERYVDLPSAAGH